MYKHSLIDTPFMFIFWIFSWRIPFLGLEIFKFSIYKALSIYYVPKCANITKHLLAKYDPPASQRDASLKLPKKIPNASMGTQISN